jgi:small subunit ribosomal protein S14
MAKESVKARNRKRQRLVARYAAKRAKLKEAGNYLALDKLPKNSSRVRVRHICRETGRPRGYMTRFGVCRIIFRKWASEGKIPGVKKASW